MRTLRAGWVSFRRIHLAALVSDWRRTLLSIVGVAVGVTVVLGTLILKVELSRPFDSFGPALAHAAGKGAVEVIPNVSGRLPIETVDRLRTKVAGAEAVIPIVAALTPVDVASTSHGFFLLGGSCQIELLVEPFNCEQRAHDQLPADGPGVPLQMPTVVAERLDLHLGDELRIPGLPPGSAHLRVDVPGVRPRRGHQRRLHAVDPLRRLRRENALHPRLRDGHVRSAQAGRRDQGRRRPRHRRCRDSGATPDPTSLPFSRTPHRSST